MSHPRGGGGAGGKKFPGVGDGSQPTGGGGGGGERVAAPHQPAPAGGSPCHVCAYARVHLSAAALAPETSTMRRFLPLLVLPVLLLVVVYIRFGRAPQAPAVQPVQPHVCVSGLPVGTTRVLLDGKEIKKLD